MTRSMVKTSLRMLALVGALIASVSVAEQISTSPSGGGSGVSGGTANRFAYFTSATALSTDATVGPFIDATNHWIGIRTATPGTLLHLIWPASLTVPTVTYQAATAQNANHTGVVTMEGVIDPISASIDAVLFNVSTDLIPTGGHVGRAIGFEVTTMIPSSVSVRIGDSPGTRPNLDGVVFSSLFKGTGNSSVWNTLIINGGATTTATGLIWRGIQNSEFIITGGGTMAEVNPYFSFISSQGTVGNEGFKVVLSSLDAGTGPVYAFYAGDLTASAGVTTGLYIANADHGAAINGDVHIGGTAAPNAMVEVSGNLLLGTALAGFGDVVSTTGGLNIENAAASSVIYMGQSSTRYGQIGWVYNATVANAYFNFGSATNETSMGSTVTVSRVRSGPLTTPAQPALANGDWWVQCSGTTPNRNCSLKAQDTAATRNIVTSANF